MKMEEIQIIDGLSKIPWFQRCCCDEKHSIAHIHLMGDRVCCLLFAVRCVYLFASYYGYALGGIWT